jgi:hypothetical protein
MHGFHNLKVHFMKKIIFALTFVTLIASASGTFAQRKIVGGEIAAGARFGGQSGLTLKKYKNSNRAALEAIAGWNFDNSIKGFALTGLFEKLAPLNSNGQLSGQFGFGATAIFGDKFYLGPTGILGFDWRVKKFPVTMSVDWMPTWILIGTSKFSSLNGAFSVRYIINHKKFD